MKNLRLVAVAVLAITVMFSCILAFGADAPKSPPTAPPLSKAVLVKDAGWFKSQLYKTARADESILRNQQLAEKLKTTDPQKADVHRNGKKLAIERKAGLVKQYNEEAPKYAQLLKDEKLPAKVNTDMSFSEYIKFAPPKPAPKLKSPPAPAK